MKTNAATARAAKVASPLDAIDALVAAERHADARLALATALVRDLLTPAELARCVTWSRQVGVVPLFLAAIARASERAVDAATLLALGDAAMEAEALAEALVLYGKGAELEPENALAHAQFGAALFRNGAFVDAQATLERAIALDPRQAPAQRALGSLRMQNRDIDGALEAMSVAVAVDPTNPDYRVSLGWVFQAKGMMEEAFLIIQSALEFDPHHAAAYSALADLFFMMRDLPRALRYFKLAADARPCAATITPYLFNLLASDATNDEEILAEHKRLGGVFDSPAARTKVHANVPDPERRLKVGFVSGDFYNHSVARFMKPLLQGLDRRRFEVYAIYNNSAEDSVSALLRSLVDHWYVCHGASDQTVADWIEREAIDILIDLSGHTNLQRLGVFGMRPAPVQATYLGYPGTTGMRSVQYRITSANVDPPGSERYYTEELVRLPGLVAPFQPLLELDVGDLPSLSGEAPFTFACLNAPWRITPSVVLAWKEILSAMPGARLRLGNVSTDHARNSLVATFDAAGIDPSRLDLTRRLQLRDYLGVHREIDLALDTFPYAGGTTTTYSLWMGVPVVTLEGTRAAARSGACILREAGLDAFVTQSVDEYVARALDWAARADDLQMLRRSMRDKLKVSRDHAEQAEQFGDALVGMWRAWCARAGEVQ